MNVVLTGVIMFVYMDEALKYLKSESKSHCLTLKNIFYGSISYNFISIYLFVMSQYYKNIN